MPLSEGQQEELDLAKLYGATAHPDGQRGVGWHLFSLGDAWVWTCARGWAYARLIDGYYRHHRYFDTLEAALHYAKQRLGGQDP